MKCHLYNFKSTNFLEFHKMDMITSLKIKKRKTSTPTITSFRCFFRNRADLFIKHKKGLHYTSITLLSFFLLPEEGVDDIAQVIAAYIQSLEDRIIELEEKNGSD